MTQKVSKLRFENGDYEIKDADATQAISELEADISLLEADVSLINANKADKTALDPINTTLASLPTTYEKRLKINVLNYGVTNDGVDTSASLLTLINSFYVTTTKSSKKYMSVELYFPSGSYHLGTVNYGQFNGLHMRGDGPSTRFISTNPKGCLVLDSTDFGERLFIDDVKICDILIDNQSVQRDGLYLNNIVRSSFKNIQIINGNSGKNALIMHMAVSNLFENISHSTNMYNLQTMFGTGISINYGTGIGASTNNTFINTVIEGVANGLIINDGDENTFIGGTFEGNSAYGIIVRGDSASYVRCRYNTFICVHMEANETTDVSDSGFGTLWQNCFTGLKGFLLTDNGRFNKIDGGIHQFITVSAGNVGSYVERAKIGHYAPPGNFVTNSNTTFTAKNVMNGNNEVVYNHQGVRQ